MPAQFILRHPRVSRLAGAIGIGVLCAIPTWFYQIYLPGPGDLRQALRPTQDWLAGRPALSWPTNADYVPSPLTIIPVGLPFVWLPEPLAGSLFAGLTCGWLFYKHPSRSWPMFLSAPFYNNALHVQFAPLLMALALSRWSVTGLLIKPHIALPLVLTYRSSRTAYISALIVLIVSLLLFGLWPLRWLSQLAPYTGGPPFLHPLGLLALVLSGLSRSGLATLYCLVPVRGPYDLLPLFLIRPNPRRLLVLALVSWLVWPLPNQPGALLLLLANSLLLLHERYQARRQMPGSTSLA